MTLTLPQAFEARLQADYGDTEGKQIAAALRQGTPTTGIRLNPAKPCALPLWAADAIPVAWCPHGLCLSSRPPFTLTPQFHQGAFYVQEPSSMTMESVVSGIVESSGLRPLTVLDLCAAPGGKTTAALAALPAGSVVVANEYVGRRAAVLEENVMKWGAPDVIVTNADTAFASRLEGVFDLILADVPCSGEGMMRKEEEARRQWTPALVEQCAAMQRSILANAAPAVKEGGYLVYSTCTFNRMENDENVAWLCNEYGFEASEPLRFLPHLTEGEGLFVCVMRKTAPEHVRHLRAARMKTEPHSLVPWLQGEGRVLIDHDATLRSVAASAMPLLEALRAMKVRICTAGVEAGFRMAKGVTPAHGAAMSWLLKSDECAVAEADEQQALSLLRCGTPDLALPSAKGITLVTHAGLPLCWVKNLGSRYNNLYPRNYRIRMV